MMWRTSKGLWAAFVVLLSGCGSGDTDGSNPPSTTSTGGGLFFGTGGAPTGGVSSGGFGGAGTGGTSGGAPGSGGQGGAAQPACPTGQTMCNGKCLSPGMSEGTCTVLADADGVAAIALDATDVYFAAAPSIGRVSKSGGAVTKLADTKDFGQAIAVNSTLVFWADGGFSQTTVYAMPKSLGTPVSIATNGDDISPLLANKSRVFFMKQHFAAPGDVVSVTTDGQNMLLHGTSDSAFDSLALDDTTLYWGDCPFTQTANLWGSPAGAASATKLATADTVYYPVLSADSVYFFESLQGQLYKVSKTGGTASVLMSPPSFRNYNPLLFGDGTHVYWIATDGIWRVGLDGQNPESVVTSGEVRTAKADASGVYFSVDRFLLKVAP